MFELLDISVAWPPRRQPFVAGRLRWLAEKGVRIDVATSTVGRLDASLMPFARVVRLPDGGESRRTVVLRALAETARGAVTDLPRLLRLVAVGRRLHPKPRRFVRWWLQAVPFLRLRPHVIHFEWNSAAVDYEWLPEFMGCPFAISCRGRQVNIVPHLPGQERFTEALARTFRNAAAVHGVSGAILEEARQLGLEAEKGHVIYTSVDIQLFSPPSGEKAARSDPIRLLNIGALMWRKGCEYLLMAIRELVDQGHDVILTIIHQEGPERDRLQYTAEDLGIVERIRLFTALPPEAVREELWSSDILLHSALSEGISNAVVEAMACAIPVVTTDCGAMREAVTDGVEGFVVPTRDPRAMAGAVARLIADPELRQRMGQAGRERVLRDFSPERQVRQFLALYETVLASRGQTR
jgi:glycosyltransferase involved in cell wall biosynthesis